MFCLRLNHLVLALVPFGIVYLKLVHNSFVWIYMRVGCVLCAWPV